MMSHFTDRGFKTFTFKSTQPNIYPFHISLCLRTSYEEMTKMTKMQWHRVRTICRFFRFLMNETTQIINDNAF